MQQPTPAISDYALIGDLRTAALVSRSGSIDWLCWPRFDSGACFAALLGRPEHGRWLVAPAADVVRTTRRYRPGTLVLETDFETAEGSVTLVDFMPRDATSKSRTNRRGPHRPRRDAHGAHRPFRLRLDRSLGDPKPRDAVRAAGDRRPRPSDVTHAGHPPRQRLDHRRRVPRRGTRERALRDDVLSLAPEPARRHRSCASAGRDGRFLDTMVGSMRSRERLARKRSPVPS